MACMASYHEELDKAGLLLDGTGLQPSSRGWRIDYEGDAISVTDGPFPETRELIAGYTLIKTTSREEALAWSKKFPNPSIDAKKAQIEVRQLFELEDFEPTETLERFREMDMGNRNA